VADLVTRARDAHASIHDQHEAFSALVARFEEMAFVTALRACRDSESARDACQEAFLIAWRKLSTLREASSFGAWIKRLVRTQCARARRRRSATAEIAGVPDTETVADIAGDASHAVSRDETQALIRRAIRNLPPKEREAILLFYFLGEPLIGMARALGVSVSAAGKRLHDARLHLRRMLPYSITEPFLNAPASASFVRLVEAGMLDEFVGEYRFDKRPDHKLVIRRETNLLVCYGGGQRNVLAGRKRDTLVPTEFDGEGRFRRDGSGEVRDFVYYEFGRRLGVARKI
jgi:RNA polymerase sigma-70 factor (ECF subfamily)